MTRILIILFFLTALFDSSYGQKQKGKKSKANVITKTVDSNEIPLQDTAFLNSIGGTSLWDCGEFVSSAFKVHFPIKSLGRTSDYEHIFTSDQISELDSIINQFEKGTTIEIAIVTIDSSWTTKERFDSLVLTIANDWGVGKKDLNNGILIGFSTGLRKIRINNGYGIETKLTDIETKKIIDDIILPEFKKGNYFEGTKNGLFAIMQNIR